MKKISYIKTGMLLFLLIAGPAINSLAAGTCTGASPNWYSTPDYASVSSCVSQATSGDTVNVGTGSAAWSSTLTLNKPITLAGAGGSSTTITHNAGGGVALISISPTTPSSFIRVTGFYFENVTYDPHTPYETYDIYINAAQSFRIDHNTFHLGAEAITSSERRNDGVIDSNTFININLSIRPNEDVNYAMIAPLTDSWNRPINAGAANSDSIFIENNNFSIDNSPGCGALNEFVYGNEGARETVRYNTFTNTCTTSGDSMVTNHGDFGEDRGAVLVEVYNNTFNLYTSYRWTTFRGGSILVHDNTITTTDHSQPGIQLWNEHDWPATLCNGTHYAGDTTWPSTDQINNSFFWNNMVNGTESKISYNDPTTCAALDQTFIQENRDYFTHAPAATGGKETYNGLPGLTNHICKGNAASVNCYEAGYFTSCCTGGTGVLGGGTGTCNAYFWGTSTYPFILPGCTGLGTGTYGTTFSSSGPNAYYPYTPYTCPHPLTGYTGSCDSSIAGTTGYNVTSILYGDVSGDGQVSAYDAALVAQSAVGLISFNSSQIKAGDVSGDGAISAYDAALIAQKAVGLITKFPVEG